MSYADPYYDQSNNRNSKYQDGADYTYNTPAYSDSDRYPPAAQNAAAPGNRNITKDTSVSAAGLYGSQGGHFNTADGFRTWRRTHYRRMWTKGSRIGCIGRFCCCTLLIAIFMIVGIILTLALYIRPPTIAIGDAALPTDGSTASIDTDSISVGMSVNISVANPNYLKIEASSIKANFTYPINNTPVGGGELDHVSFHPHSTTNFTFPFTITYLTADDPSGAVLEDLITKCGFLGGQQEEITVNYSVTVALTILSVTVRPSFTSTLSFDCPFTLADLEGALGSGINITSIFGGT